MQVILLTLFFSLLLAVLFILLFARDARSRRFSSHERSALLPLDDEKQTPAKKPKITR